MYFLGVFHHWVFNLNKLLLVEFNLAHRFNAAHANTYIKKVNIGGCFFKKTCIELFDGAYSIFQAPVSLFEYSLLILSCFYDLFFLIIEIFIVFLDSVDHLLLIFFFLLKIVNDGHDYSNAHGDTKVQDVCYIPSTHNTS